RGARAAPYKLINSTTARQRDNPEQSACQRASRRVARFGARRTRRCERKPLSRKLLRHAYHARKNLTPLSRTLRAIAHRAVALWFPGGGGRKLLASARTR